MMKKINEYKERFRLRGYTEVVLQKSIEKTNNKTRMALLTKTIREEKQSLVFVSQYSTCSTEIKNIIRKKWELLQQESDFHGCFNEGPTFAYKRGRNLKELLTPKDHSAQQTQYKGTKKCMNCVNCNNIIVGDILTHPITGKGVKLRHTSDCNTKNVVYCLKCPCGKAYVGKTERKFKSRLTEHKSTIRNKNLTSSVATHWIENRHTISQLRAQIIEIVHPKEAIDIKSRLLQREVFWIDFLCSQTPRGLNDRVDLNCYL